MQHLVAAYKLLQACEAYTHNVIKNFNCSPNNIVLLQ